MDDDPPRFRPVRRRLPRASRACETCRVRKTKCDQAQPCSYCAYHCLGCVYRAGAGTENTSTPEKRQSRIRQIQHNKTRPSPWPGVNQNDQVSQERHFPDSLIEGSARMGNNATTPVVHGGMDRIGSRNDSSMAAETPLCDYASRDGLSGINLHTNGTEFYGNSSNLAFLGNLYARARNQAENRTSNTSDNGVYLNSDFQSASRPSQPATSQRRYQVSDKHADSTKAASDKAQLSIVNLLYNPNYPSHSPPSQSPLESEQDRERRSVQIYNPGTSSENIITGSGIAPVDQLSRESQLEIEKIFISSYFSNKHYIHPMLCKATFMRRCEHEAFNLSKRSAFARGSSKFAGLYFAVVALGAINASPNETSLLDHYCTYSPDPSKAGTAGGYSSLDFANFYFRVAKQALGDVFESCSLESAQALMLLNVFCQNALRPHSCFMYAGMAVRTAVAIGLASGMSSLPANMRKDGKRTWWCIYSHEVEMCCSSGRQDSMKEHHYYQVPLPTLKATPGHEQDPDAEDNDIAMIPVMVALAQIMSEASHLLYHSTKRTMSEKSHVAMNLDRRLSEWKSKLPSFLNIDAASLNDPEWAFKQKLVLRLRFYNTSILIHRPFLVASTSTSESATYLQHVHLCLSAARTSIQIQYESFLHRIYIRTWWYNTTYVLYGAMILLHLILGSFPGIPEDELLLDAEKSLDLFESMKNIIVARRCAEMIREVLDVTRSYLARRRMVSHAHAQTYAPFRAQHQPTPVPTSPPFTLENGAVEDTSNLQYLSTNTNTTNHNYYGNPNNQAIHTPPPNLASTSSPGPSPDENFFFSLFGQEEFQPDTRAEILANLVDPMILGDFAFGDGGVWGE